MPPFAVVLLVVVGLFALLGVLTLLMSRPARIRVETVGDSVVVELSGLDRFWCVRRRLVVPLSSITDVRVARRAELRRPGVRLPGAYLPGVIIAGSYGLGEHRTFWDVRRADRLLVIDRGTAPGHHQLVLEVPDPDSTAASLRQRIA